MTEKGYRQKIKTACIGVGTYRKEFEEIIGRLAELYVRHDTVREEFENSGEDVIVEQINKGGNSYMTRNPYLVVLDSTDKLILELEREHGLTPASLRKINESALRTATEEPDKLSNVLTLLHSEIT